MSDIKYRHLSDAELKSRIEQFGTDNEREILSRFNEPDWDNCPNCEAKDREMLSQDEGIRAAIDILEDALP